jgi:hypothetical protein
LFQQGLANVNYKKGPINITNHVLKISNGVLMLMIPYLKVKNLVYPDPVDAVAQGQTVVVALPEKRRRFA